jgi:hypothetical protein
MLDEATRTAILKLAQAGHGARTIARDLKLARTTVRRVLASGSAEVPAMKRTELPEPYREQILELLVQYKGHIGRVHEALVQRGATFSYPALTAFCRRHELAGEPRRPAGRYTFGPAIEMQHDTSPHRAEIGGVMTAVQTASLVLCYSRMIFFQCYPRFTRFECKAFLAQAIEYFNGAAAVCMIDNSHVVVAAGSGATMIPAPEMAAFAARYGFAFKAHDPGDANRSARVEAPFYRIERGFLEGSPFADWKDLNGQARETCDAWNVKFSNKLHASLPSLCRVLLELVELVQLKPQIGDQLVRPLHHHPLVDHGAERRWRGRLVGDYRAQVVATHGRRTSHVHEPQQRRGDVDELDRCADAFRCRARSADDQRYVHLFLVQRRAVIDATVLTELFAVIRSDDDHDVPL